MKQILLYIQLSILIFASNTAVSAEVTILHSFKAGESAKADEVNNNFDAVKAAIDDNHQKIGTATASTESNSAEIDNRCFSS